MKILKLLTILTLTLFPFGELLRFEIVKNIAFKPIDIAVGLAAAYWIVSKLIKTRHPKDISWLFLAFPLIGLLSLIINSIWLKPYEILTSFLYLARWVSYAAIFFIVLSFDIHFKKKIWHFLFIDGLIILLVGYLQYFFFPSLKSLYYLGWDEHMHRMFSVFLDPNYAGAFFVLYFLFIGGMFIKKEKMRYLPNYVLSIIFFLTLIAIFLTFSRAALLMLIVGSSIFLFLIKRKRLILILIGSILLFALIFSSKFNIENINLFREASSKARISNSLTAIKIISDHPILGVGFNTYRYAKASVGIPHDWVKAPSHADAGVDNSFLFVLATTGIIGLAAYFGLWRMIFKKAWQLYTKKSSTYAIIVISSGFGLFVNSLFINSLFFAPLMLWAWVVIGLMEE